MVFFLSLLSKLDFGGMITLSHKKKKKKKEETQRETKQNENEFVIVCAVKNDIVRNIGDECWRYVLGNARKISQAKESIF